jgi:hypothetical protein
MSGKARKEIQKGLSQKPNIGNIASRLESFFQTQNKKSGTNTLRHPRAQ